MRCNGTFGENAALNDRADWGRTAGGKPSREESVVECRSGYPHGEPTGPRDILILGKRDLFPGDLRSILGEGKERDTMFRRFLGE